MRAGVKAAGGRRLPRPDNFLLVMLCAVTAALVWPAPGLPDGPLHLGIVTRWGIALVFFLHGANLSPAAVRAGLGHWRLHLLVQASTFLLFPLIGWPLLALGHRLLPEDLAIGFFYLCALPSTVSSSVAMTALARGNVPAAVFNASLSGLIGLVVTPLLVAVALGSGGGHMPPLGRAVLDVALTLLLPFALGQLARPLLAGTLARTKRWTTTLDRGVIILIVYGSFASSTAAGVWRQFTPGLFAMVVLVTGLILALALILTTLASRALGFDRADEAALVFCGSKKSLANGAPMAKILFAGHPALGVIMLPILLYHQFQLFVCSLLARRYAARADA